MKRNREESGADVDADYGFLDQVLNKLYDFGDGGRSKSSKKLNKKKRKNKEDDDDEEEGGLNERDSCVKASSSHMAVVAFHDNSMTLCTESQSPSPVPRQSDVEVVTFQDPLKKNPLKRAVKPEAQAPPIKVKKKDPDDILSIEKARLEVHRFGITGFQKQQQRVFEQERAIMLGARPPKKEYVNYKVYQKMIKEKRLMEKQEAKSDAQRKHKKSGKQKSEKRKAAPSVKEPTGLMGRFKNGVLVLKSRDIQKVTSKRRK